MRQRLRVPLNESQPELEGQILNLAKLCWWIRSTRTTSGPCLATASQGNEASDVSSGGSDSRPTPKSTVTSSTWVDCNDWFEDGCAPKGSESGRLLAAEISGGTRAELVGTPSRLRLLRLAAFGRALGRNPASRVAVQVSMKWSHASWPFRHAENYLETRQREFLRAVESLGVGRILWASDVTQDETPGELGGTAVLRR